MLTKPCTRLRPVKGEMKLRHGFCRKSLRPISFATSLYTREAFADRQLQTGLRRVGEMKLWHNLCHQSLRLISFATSLYTREAFAARRLQTGLRRVGEMK